MAIHSTSLAWAEDPGRLQSMGSQKRWTDLATKQQKQHPVSIHSTNIDHFGLLAKELLA